MNNTIPTIPTADFEADTAAAIGEAFAALLHLVRVATAPGVSEADKFAAAKALDKSTWTLDTRMITADAREADALSLADALRHNKLTAVLLGLAEWREPTQDKAARS